MAIAVTKSEDQYGKKWDHFGANCVVKMGTGLLVGSVFSLILFRRRMWPITFGVGTGFGFAANDFQHDLMRK